MEVQIQNLSRPSNGIPAILPLAYLAPGQIGGPDSGVEAFGAGIKEGQAVVAPLAEMGNYLTQYSSPESEAKRKAAIAQAGLVETTAGQENEAAKATPDLPLAQRQFQGEQIASGRTLLPAQTNLALARMDSEGRILPAQTDLTLAKIGSEAQLLPGQTEASAAANRAALLNANNVLSTTPSYAPNMTQDEIMRNEAAKKGALSQAGFQREVAIASNPFLASDGITAPEGKYVSNGKLLEDTVTQRNVQGEDGKIYIQNVWSHSGKPVSYLQDQLSGTNATIEAANERQGRGIAARSPTYGAEGAQVTLTPAESTQTNKAIQNFKGRGDVQAVVKITPLVDRALSQINASRDAKTGLVSVDAMLSAARAFRGQVTDSEMKQLSNAGGLQQNLYQLFHILDGKKFDERTMSDLTASLLAVRKEGDEFLNNRILPDFKKSLPLNARPIADDLFGQVAYRDASHGEQAAQPGEPPIIADKTAYDALPKGTPYRASDGQLYIKGQ